MERPRGLVSLSGQNGALWIGTKARACTVSKRFVEEFQYCGGIYNPYVWSLAEDSKGDYGWARGAADFCSERRFV